ncbi:MAG: hypothetical protein AAFV33_20095 [Chloroflexota bacterium]
MAYVERKLEPGEQVEVKVKVHWWLLAEPFLGVFIVIGSLMAFITSQLNDPTLFAWAVIPALFMSLIRLPNFLRSELAITTKRIIGSIGYDKTIEVFLEDVDEIQAKRGIVGSLFRFDTVIIKHFTGKTYLFRRIASARKLLEYHQAYLDSQNSRNDFPHE